jgi:hypothetical protein
MVSDRWDRVWIEGSGGFGGEWILTIGVLEKALKDLMKKVQKAAATQ